MKDTTTITIHFNAFGGSPSVTFDVPTPMAEHLDVERVADAVFTATNAPVEVIRGDVEASVIFTAMAPLRVSTARLRAVSVSDVITVGHSAVRVERTGFTHLNVPPEEDGERAHTALTSALSEWADAIRGYWGDIDGRSLRLDILEMVAAVENGNTRTIEQWRADLLICPDGGRHWKGFCETSEGCPSLRGTNNPSAR